MGFSFKDAIEQSKKFQTTTVEGIILSPSGGGKSGTCGTLPGPILYLYTTDEDHGPQAAQALIKSRGLNTQVIPVPVDIDDDGKPLSASNTMKKIQNILREPKLGESGIKSVVFDGMTALNNIILKTDEFKTYCMTSSGEHNGFKETEAAMVQFKSVINDLKTLRNKFGMNYIITGVLDVKKMDDDGTIVEAVPRLVGYGVAEFVIQSQGDVYVVGEMTNGEEFQHRFQFNTAVTKTSKDAKTKKVKKTINFRPRIKNVHKVDETLPADFTEVIKLKEKLYE